jgi:Domain of unknown function (DUF4184)
MPFTISHAAVVLPFSRLLARWRLLSAVVIGAMVPDFGLFFPWRVHRFETHSAMALLTFCLPVGLVTYWAFQYLVKTPILEVLPEGAYARWRLFSSPADVLSIRQWVLAACGLLAGAVTHLVWDAFTHENARGIRLIPWIEDPVVDIGSHRLAGVPLLQDGSSLIGLVVVAGLLLYGLRRGAEKTVPARPLRAVERRVWVLVYVISAVGLSIAWYLWVRAWAPSGHAIRMRGMVITNIAVASLRGLAMALFCTSLAVDWRLRALRSSTRRSP